MHKTMRARLGGGGRGLVLGAAGLAAGATIAPGVSSAVESFKDVIVRNTAAQPVPVALTDNTVALANNGVVVQNGTDAPVPVAVTNAAGGRQPFQRHFSISMLSRVGSADIYTVPAGKVLTIEYASMNYQRGIGLTTAGLVAQCGGAQGEVHSGSHLLARQDNGTFFEVIGGPLALHAGAGQCLQAHVTVEDYLGQFYVNGTVSGYLTDAN